MKIRNLTVLLFCMMVIPAASVKAQQLIKTQLVVTIRNELGNTEEGVNVKLYEQEDDYLGEKNAAAEGVTDKKGVVKFKDLKAVAYYVLARKGEINNFGGGEKTGVLEDGRINKVTIVIE